MAAIEIYNKPDFLYREETFSILALNSWELLLKAKLVKDNKGNIGCLYIREHRMTKSGKNRLGSHQNRTCPQDPRSPETEGHRCPGRTIR